MGVHLFIVTNYCRINLAATITLLIGQSKNLQLFFPPLSRAADKTAIKSCTVITVVFRPLGPRQLSSIKYRHGEFSSRKLCRYIRDGLLSPVRRAAPSFCARAQTTPKWHYRWFTDVDFALLSRETFRNGGGRLTLDRTHRRCRFRFRSRISVGYRLTRRLLSGSNL